MSTGRVRRRRCAGDTGQALPLITVIIAVAGLAAVVLAQLGGAAVARARAGGAADAAALAGAVDGRAAADDLARANGGSLVSFERRGPVVEVVVQVGRATARARAEATGSGGPSAAGLGERAGLAPVVLAALARAEDVLGRPVPIASGFRSRAEQERLWARRATNPYPVAVPGTSAHERGMAIDVPVSFAPLLASVAGASGLCQPLPASDPVHFEPCRSDR
jgi:D-alanyl-D-alanine carboxypeptidase